MYAIRSYYGVQEKGESERKRLAAKPTKETFIAGNLQRGKAGAAAAVAVDAGEHDAGEAYTFVERTREIDRVLTP